MDSWPQLMEEKAQGPPQPLGGRWASAVLTKHTHVSLGSHDPEGFQKPHFSPASSIHTYAPSLGLSVTSALPAFTPGHHTESISAVTADPCLDLQTSHRGRAAMVWEGTSAGCPRPAGLWGAGSAGLWCVPGTQARTPVPQEEPCPTACAPSPPGGPCWGQLWSQGPQGPGPAVGDPFQLHLSI